MNKQTKMGIASISIAAVGLLFFALASPLGILVASVGLFMKSDERRELNWVCLLGLVLNVVVVWMILPFVLMALGR